MMNLIFLGPLATAATILGSSTIVNISQTFMLVRENEKNQNTSFLKQKNQKNGKTLLTLSGIKSMKRDDLIRLYLSPYCSEPKKISNIAGEWEGQLLDNNGFLMTGVSSILTNSLFSRNRRWRGKCFQPNNRIEETRIGMNRFQNRKKQSISTTMITSVETEHSFDYSISPSRLDKGNSLVLNYSKYQSNLSLWKSMVDELRLIKVIDDENGKVNGETKSVLLGIGSMAWSGGSFNGAPFLLKKID